MVKSHRNNLKKSFLDQYREESYDLQKKMEYLFYFSQIGVLLFAGLLLIRIFGNSNIYLITGDAFLGLILLISFLGIYFKRPLLASNSVNLIPFTVLCYHVIEEYKMDLPVNLDSLFASLAFLIFGLLFMSLFALRRRQLVLYALFSTLTLLAHYYVLVEMTYDGVINALNLTHIAAAILGLLAAVIMASLVLHLLHEVIHLAKKSHKITETKYNYLFSSIRDVFGYFRLLRDKSGKAIDFEVLEYNKALLYLLGLENQEDITGKLYSELEIVPELKERKNFWVKLFDKVNQENEEYFDEFYSTPLNKWFLITITSPYKDECVLIMRDISELKKQQKDLEKSKSLAEESDRLKSTFLNTISHEVRTPLNQITGLLAVVKDKYSNNREMQEINHLVNHSSSYLIEIIDNLMEASLMETGRQDVNLAFENLDMHIDGYVYFIHDHIKASNKQNKVDFQLEKHLNKKDIVIKTDIHKLTHIVKKLLSNAVKYTEEGLIKLSIYRKEDMLVFKVSDTGVGIEDDKMNVIFKKFRQGDEGTKRKYGGLGLGLSISSYFASKLHGKITVNSEPGKGSDFYFYHPLK